ERPVFWQIIRALGDFLAVSASFGSRLFDTLVVEILLLNPFFAGLVPDRKRPVFLPFGARQLFIQLPVLIPRLLQSLGQAIFVVLLNFFLAIVEPLDKCAVLFVVLIFLLFFWLLAVWAVIRPFSIALAGLVANFPIESSFFREQLPASI